MDLASALQANLLSPAVLCFLLGAAAALCRSDLKFPEPVYFALTTYLLVAIGLKGGAAIAEAGLDSVWLPALGAMTLGALASVMDKFHYLKIGLGVVLSFLGVKMLLGHTEWKIDTHLSLGVIVTILSASIIASLMWPPVRKPDPRPETAGPEGGFNTKNAKKPVLDAM